MKDLYKNTGFKEFAIKNNITGSFRRNKFLNPKRALKQGLSQNNKGDVYLSVYNFRRKKQSIQKMEDKDLIFDRLVYDFDVKIEDKNYIKSNVEDTAQYYKEHNLVEQAYNECVQVYDFFFNEFGVKGMLYFSGNKGYHLEIILNDEIKVSDVKSTIAGIGNFLKEKFNLVTIDSQVYTDTHRVIRIPTSKHHTTGLYNNQFMRKDSYSKSIDLSIHKCKIRDLIIPANDTINLEKWIKEFKVSSNDDTNKTSTNIKSNSKKKSNSYTLKELSDEEITIIIDVITPIYELDHSKHEISLYLGGFFSNHITKDSTIKIIDGVIANVGSLMNDTGAFKHTVLQNYSERDIKKGGLPKLCDLIKDVAPKFDTTDLEKAFIEICMNKIYGGIELSPNIFQFQDNDYYKDGLYQRVWNKQDQCFDYKFYGNVLIHELNVTYDRLGLFPAVVSLKYTNTTINKTYEIIREPFSVVAHELHSKLLVDTNSQGVESFLRKTFTHGVNKDLKNITITADEDLLKDGFFYDIDNDILIANNVFDELNSSREDVQNAIHLFNEIIEDRGTAIPNDCAVFRFMLWSPFGYALKQIGFIDDLYSVVAWGVTDTNKTGSCINWSYLYSDMDTVLQKANTQSALGTRLGENTFPLVLDENKDILSDDRNEEFLKNIVTDKIGRSVKDKSDNNLMNDFPALRMTISTLNQDLTYKDEFKKRYKILYYDKSMQVDDSSKKAFNKKYMPKSPSTPLAQLKHLGKAFYDRFKPYVEEKKGELYDLEALTIKILKSIQQDFGVDFNLNVFLTNANTVEGTDTESIIRNGLNRLFRKNHKLNYTRNEQVITYLDFQECAKLSEISWLDYKPNNDVYYIKVKEFEKEISSIVGEHIPVQDTLKMLNVPVSEIKKRKFKSSNVETIIVDEYNLTFKMFNINIYDKDTLREIQEDEEN